jgi:hypothetical protein
MAFFAHSREQGIIGRAAGGAKRSRHLARQIGTKKLSFWA